jgi:type II secretory pathway pseudopilin PulG
MIKFLKQKNKRESGFTLIETLIALSIFIVSVVGIMSVLATGLTDINSAKKKTTATFLAQEGIEYIRNIRDTYVLYSSSSSIGWNQFLTSVVTICGNNNGCYFNDQSLAYFDPNLPITNITINSCDAIGCPKMYFNDSNGRYNSGQFGNSGSVSSFTRKIKVEKIGVGEEAKVTSTVYWGTGNSNSITLTENLFNWY